MVSLKKRKEILFLKKKGSRLKKGFYFIMFCKNELDYCLFAWCFPRWTGSAVRRNLFKRWAREFFRRKQWAVGLDLLVGFEKTDKAFYETVTYEKFYAGFEEICQNINV